MNFEILLIILIDNLITGVFSTFGSFGGTSCSCAPPPICPPEPICVQQPVIEAPSSYLPVQVATYGGCYPVDYVS